MKRFEELEGLRGIAAIVVVIYHMTLFFLPGAFYGPGSIYAPFVHSKIETFLFGNPLASLFSGSLAVAIFFVLSGFVLSIGFFTTGKESIIKKLAAKRYLRLMLPALASVMIAALLIKLGWSANQEAARITGSSWLSQMWNIPHPGFLDAFTQGTYGAFFNGQSYYNAVLWTMQYEFTGSFMVFISAWILYKHPRRWIIYAALALLLLKTWFLAFIIGMLIADLYASGKLDFIFKPITAVLLLGLALLFGGYPLPQAMAMHNFYSGLKLPTFTIDQTRNFYTTVAAVLIIFVILHTPKLRNFLSRPYISRLGKYTYSLYLVHKLLIFSVMSIVFVKFINDGVHYGWAVLFSIAITIPFIVMVTWLFEKLVDAPAIIISGKLLPQYSGTKKEIKKTKRIASDVEVVRPSSSASSG